MTQEELNALPDVTDTIGQREHIVDGQRFVVPVQQRPACALFHGPDDGLVMDAAGKWWMTGWLEGRRVKREFHGAGAA